MGAFFLWVRRRGFAPAPPSRFPARSVPLTRLFSTCVSTAACHSSPRDPSDAKRARKTWRFGVRGMRERKRERESDTQRAGVRFFFCAPFSTHGKARYDGPCRQSRLMLAKQQVSRLHSAGETDVFGPEVCASERERECVRGARGGGMRQSATPPYLPPYLPGELSWQTHLAAAGTNAGCVATTRPTRRRRPTGTGGENA